MDAAKERAVGLREARWTNTDVRWRFQTAFRPNPSRCGEGIGSSTEHAVAVFRRQDWLESKGTALWHRTGRNAALTAGICETGVELASQKQVPQSATPRAPWKVRPRVPCPDHWLQAKHSRFGLIPFRRVPYVCGSAALASQPEEQAFNPARRVSISGPERSEPRIWRPGNCCSASRPPPLTSRER